MNFKRLFLLMLVAIIGFSTMVACGPGEEEEDKGPSISDRSDDAGNLLLVNESNARLVLYHGEKPVKIVPNSLNDFVVNIDMTGSQVADLKLFKEADVKNDYNNPSDEDLFKRWVVPLPEETTANTRSTWTIFPSAANPDGSVDSKQQGTVNFRYTAGSTYSGNAVNVEIFLNNTQGARIATLRPGDNRQVALDMGLHKIVYRYWYSDPNTTATRDWLGVRETNMDGHPIFVSLADADNRRSAIEIVPGFDANKVTGSDELYSATVTIYNDENLPVYIWADGALINETLNLGDGMENLISGANHPFIFSIEGEDATRSVTLRAANVDGGTICGPHIIELKADDRWTWRVGQDPVKQE